MQHPLSIRLGYVWKDPDLLMQSLTHPSYRHGTVIHYERLEFLGDAALYLVVTDMLYRAFPQASEGEMAARRVHYVNERCLASLAESLDLATYIRQGQGGAAPTSRTLANVMEALLGSIYCDGGYDAVHSVIVTLLGDRVFEPSLPPLDAKSSLQTITQHRRLGLPIYQCTQKEGDDHSPSFTVSVTVPTIGVVEAQGKSKKEVEQEGARRMIAMMEKSQ